jgi:hypothetical protein
VIRIARRRRLTFLLVLAVSLSGCGVKRRVLGVLGADQGILLVRHNQPVAQEIRIGETVLGVALPGAIACFQDLASGPGRAEAHAVGSGTLTRATDLVITAERTLLWDLDHQQVVDGRAYRGLCD